MSNLNELSLILNEELLYIDLIEYVFRAVEITANKLLSDFRQQWNSKVDSSAVLNIKLVGSGMAVEAITAIVGNDHWYALLDNYGTGSKMSANNPWLTEYISSGYFNRERLNQSLAVVGRPEGKYISPDYSDGQGEIYLESKGYHEGENLETKINPKTGRPYFNPISPKFWLEESMEKIEKVFFDNIVDAVNSFPFDSNKYLKGGV